MILILMPKEKKSRNNRDFFLFLRYDNSDNIGTPVEKQL